MKAFLLALLMCTIYVPSVLASETDNFNLIDPSELDDGQQILNDHFNKQLQRLTEHLNKNFSKYSKMEREDLRKAVADKYYSYIEGNFVAAKSSHLIKNNLHTQKILLKNSIYSDVTFAQASVLKVYPLAYNLRVGNVVFGNDKLLHFLTVSKQIYNYYWKAYAALPEENMSFLAMTSYIMKTEREEVGLGLTRVYSNADMVADFEGAKMYDSLIYPHQDQAPFLVLEEGAFRLVKKFSIESYVSPFWNEVILPSFYPSDIRPMIAHQIQTHCEDYLSKPEFFEITQEQRAQLAERYQALPLVTKNILNVNEICK